MVKRSAIMLVVLALVGMACSGDDDPEPSGPTAGSVELTIFAASSLTAAFDDPVSGILRGFVVANPEVRVVPNYGPSDGLAGQIQSEGTADVFISASAKWMDAVAEDPGVTGRVDFAKNRLVIITPAGNPAGVTSIEDLAEDGVKLVLAAEGVPVGDYSREALTNAGILDGALANVVSNEEDNASVVAKIQAGEADAAIVYESDVSEKVRGDLVAVEIPDDVNVIATYPVAVVTGTTHPDAAAAFVEYLTGTEGQATLEAFGFMPAA
jgi:molybdate transport system substrate-binding protein